MNADSNARVLIACATHWTTSIAYFAPVVAFAGWLTWVTVREKRQAKATSG
jgi:hypothetical protein